MLFSQSELSIYRYVYYIFYFCLFFIGKMCVLDCAPQSLKLLHNSSEFLPYVVMISAPGIEQLRNLTYASNRNLTVKKPFTINSNLLCEVFFYVAFRLHSDVLKWKPIPLYGRKYREWTSKSLQYRRHGLSIFQSRLHWNIQTRCKWNALN